MSIKQYDSTFSRGVDFLKRKKIFQSCCFEAQYLFTKE